MAPDCQNTFPLELHHLVFFDSWLPGSLSILATMLTFFRNKIVYGTQCDALMYIFKMIPKTRQHVTSHTCEFMSVIILTLTIYTFSNVKCSFSNTYNYCCLTLWRQSSAIWINLCCLFALCLVLMTLSLFPGVSQILLGSTLKLDHATFLFFCLIWQIITIWGFIHL